jgi:hypothetical protein
LEPQVVLLVAEAFLIVGDDVNDFQYEVAAL